MNGPCAHHVIQVKLFQQSGPQDNQHTGDPADDNGLKIGHAVTIGRDTHQARQDTVQGRDNLGTATGDPAIEHCHCCATCRSEGGIGSDQHYRVGIGRSGECQLTTGIESKPADPDNKHAKARQNHAVPRNGVSAAVTVESPDSWA